MPRSNSTGWNFEKDAQAGPALNRMQEILSAPSPYGLIKEADSLISSVSAVNSSLLSDRRAEGIAKIDAHIAALNKDLAAAQGEAVCKRLVWSRSQPCESGYRSKTASPTSPRPRARH